MVENKFPALGSEGAGRGAAWRPIQSALAQKDTDEWGPKHKGALRSLIAGRQWPEQRLHSAGLVESNLCQLCFTEPGTLLHRLVCPVLARFRQEHMPKWIQEHLENDGPLSDCAFLAVTRGLFPAPPVPARGASGFDTFAWYQQCDVIPAGCLVFTDGSLLDGKMPRGCQSLGWAFVLMSPMGSFLAAASGVPRCGSRPSRAQSCGLCKLPSCMLPSLRKCTQIATQCV